MRVTVTNPERQLIERVLLLANMREIKSTKQVESLFTDLPFVGFYDQNQQRRFQGLKSSEIAVYKETQRDLQQILGDIASGDSERRAQVIDKIRHTLVPVLLVPSEQGKPLQIYGFTGVEACWRYVVWLLLDPTRGLMNRLGHCDAPRCNKFNLAFTGRPRRYCNESHRLAADALRVNERVKQWRAWVKKHGGRKKREPVSSAE
jgi:hypothetical protein